MADAWPFMLHIGYGRDILNLYDYGDYYDEEEFYYDTIDKREIVPQITVLEESPTCRLLQSVHNTDLNGVLKAITEGARLMYEDQNVLEYALKKVSIPRPNGQSQVKVKAIEICLYLMETHSNVLTERCAKKILDMDIQDLTKGMIKVLEVTNEDLSDRLFLEICSTGWEFPIAQIYFANNEKYNRITDGSPGFHLDDDIYYRIRRGWGARRDNRMTFGEYDHHPSRDPFARTFGYLTVDSFINHLTTVQLELYVNGYDINYFDDNGFGNVLPQENTLTKEMFRT